MVKKKVEKNSQIEIKNFRLEDIRRGIKKLKRRIDDVNNLESGQVSHDDRIVANVKNDIRETIREVFGSNSPEFNEHQYHEIWHGGYNVMDDDTTSQDKFTAGIPQTVKMLEGLIKRLGEKRMDLNEDSSAQIERVFKSAILHSRIADACRDLYRDGHYADAVFNASKELINFVKEKSKKHELDGADLMRNVFSPRNPVLAFNDLNDQSDKDEQEGMMHLFEGVVLAIRNPGGHSFPYVSPERALEYIGLLSLLANLLEEANYHR